MQYSTLSGVVGCQVKVESTSRGRADLGVGEIERTDESKLFLFSCVSSTCFRPFVFVQYISTFFFLAFAHTRV